MPDQVTGKRAFEGKSNQSVAAAIRTVAAATNQSQLGAASASAEGCGSTDQHDQADTSASAFS
jgi:hypothetical protein